MKSKKFISIPETLTQIQHADIPSLNKDQKVIKKDYIIKSQKKILIPSENKQERNNSQTNSNNSLEIKKRSSKNYPKRDLPGFSQFKVASSIDYVFNGKADRVIEFEQGRQVTSESLSNLKNDKPDKTSNSNKFTSLGDVLNEKNNKKSQELPLKSASDDLLSILASRLCLIEQELTQNKSEYDNSDIELRKSKKSFFDFLKKFSGIEGLQDNIFIISEILA